MELEGKRLLKKVSVLEAFEKGQTSPFCHEGAEISCLPSNCSSRTKKMRHEVSGPYIWPGQCVHVSNYTFSTLDCLHTLSSTKFWASSMVHRPGSARLKDRKVCVW